MAKKLLIVDDDPVIRTLVTEYLQAFGYELTIGESGAECLSLLDASDPLPDALVLDLIMPDMTGFDVLKALRENPRLEKLPVILLSANSDSEDDAKEHGVSADYYLLKPFEMQEIIKAIEQITA